MRSNILLLLLLLLVLALLALAFVFLRDSMSPAGDAQPPPPGRTAPEAAPVLPAPLPATEEGRRALEPAARLVEEEPAAAGVLRGRVQDAAGVAFPDAEVLLWKELRSTWGQPPEARVPVAADGSFELETVGAFVLGARTPSGYRETAFLTGNIGAGEERSGLVLELLPARPVTVTVLGPDGGPAAGVDVSLGRLEGGSGPTGVEGVFLDRRCLRSRRTDARGCARFPEVPAVPLQAHTWVAGHVVAELPPAASEVLVQLPPAPELLPAELAVRVLDPSGVPLGEAPVALVGRERPEPVQGTTDATGLCLFQDLESSPVDRRWHVLAAPPPERSDLAPAWRPDVLPEKQEGPVELVLPPGQGIAGRVTDAEGRPQAGVTVAVLTEHRVPTNRSPSPRVEGLLGRAATRTDAEGGFRLPALAGGPCTVLVPGFMAGTDAPELMQWPVAMATARPGDRDVHLVLGRSALVFEGRVLRAVDQEPVAGAKVALWWQDDDMAMSRSSTLADEEGRYRLETVRTRGVYLVAEAKGLLPARIEARDWEPGEHEVDLVLSPAVDLDLRVVDVAGTPVPGASVGGSDASGQVLEFWETPQTRRSRMITGGDGRVRLTPVPVAGLVLDIEDTYGMPSYRAVLDPGDGSGRSCEVRLPWLHVGERSGVRVRLPAVDEAGWHGTVRLSAWDAAGRPVHRLDLTWEGGSWKYPFGAVTESKPECAATLVLPAREECFLRAEAEGWQPVEVPIPPLQPAEERVREVEVPMTRG